MAHISFRLFLVLLLWIQTCLYAEGHGGIIEKHALVGQQVNLTCYLNSTEDVTWRYSTDGAMFPISTCKDNQNGQCPFANAVLLQFNFQATRSNKTSVLSLTPSGEEEHDFMCIVGNDILQEYLVKSIDPSNIVPNCIVALPSNDSNGGDGMTLSCEVNTDELDVNLTLEGIGLKIPDDSPGSSKNIKAKTLYFDDFNNIHTAFCKAYFPDIDITRSCTYPNILKAQYIVEGNDIIIKCDDELDVVYWRFYGSDGRQDNIEDRSWIREGGRSLLIRDISERDVGKLVVCRTKGNDNQTNKGTVAFNVILKSPRDINNSEDRSPTAKAHNTYFVLTIFSLVLWLITNAVCGVLLGYRLRRSHEVSTIPRTIDDEQTPLAPEYATFILSTGGGNDLDIQGSSSGDLGLTGEEPEGERKKSSRKESNAHYMDLSGNHGPTEYETTLKSVFYESPRAENDVVPEGSNQVDSMSGGGTAMAKGQVKLKGSKANYMDMSGNHGRTDYEAMKSLTYANV